MKKLIQDMHEGESVITFFGVVSKAMKKTKDDKPYLDLTLCDRTGKINAKIWDKADELSATFNQGEAVKVQGVVAVFNNELQLKVEKIRRVIPEKDSQEGFEVADLIPTTTKDIETLWKDLVSATNSMTNPFLHQLTSELLNTYAEKLKFHPGSMTLHHAYRGGLVEHLHAMVFLAEKICEYYEELDRDLVLAGVLLHDIGKLEELETGLITRYTDAGNFIGHLVLGRDIVHAACLKIPDFPEILRLKLEHIILSHQGRYEWQSPREPQFIEALVVYYLDEIDTRINQMKKDIEDDLSEGAWTARSGYFHRALYKGND